jgi:D-threonate/D-erythronate kinase
MTARADPECILIADDVTGACDTGVQFARHGLSSTVWLDPTRVPSTLAQVVALNTDSRCDEGTAAKAKIQQIASLYSEIKPGIILKKIDSTLRGNVGQEILATMKYFRRDCAIIAPAFPAMGRTVRNGILEWKDGSGAGSVDIGELLQQQGIPSQRIVRTGVSTQDAAGEALLGNMNANPGMFIVTDCTEQKDLGILVSRAYHLRQRLLWIGAAGLGMALARKLGNSTPKQSATLSKDASVLFWIGSTHPVTQDQRDVFLKDSAGIEIVAEPGTLAIARRAIQEKRRLLLKIEREHTTSHSLDAFLNGLKDLAVAGMLFTGGDTAMLVCNCLGAYAIRLVDEIAPGIPWGNLCGGSFDGLPVATKAGGFGDRDALLRCEEFFGSGRKVMA